MITKLRNELKSDCGACSGLCCVALFFARTDGFPYDKDTGVPCRNLRDDFRCSIHDELAARSLKGCIAYDCFGAGPKATGLCGKQAWRESPAGARETFAVFLAIHRLCQMLWYLLDAEQEMPSNEIRRLIEENVQAAQTAEKVLEFDFDGYKARVDAVLKKFAGTPAGQDCVAKNFKGKNLEGADFSMSLLIAANMDGCRLAHANFLGADMRDANLCNADLSRSIFLTQGQVNAARGNGNTKLPPWIDVPAAWNKKG